MSIIFVLQTTLVAFLYTWCGNNRNYVELHSTFYKLQLNFAKMFILTESLLIQSYDSDE